MKLTLLGTGDAIGTPKIGCTCPQCEFARKYHVQRLRTSLLIEHRGKNILIDTSPDLRQQLLLNGSPSIDSVVWTHGHYDHFMGFGEFYRVQALPEVYAAPEVLSYCGEIFKFLSFHGHAVEPYRTFDLHGLEVTLIEVNHPDVFTCGVVLTCGDVRIGYTSDSRTDIPPRSIEALKDVNLLLIDALVPPRYHISKHMNYREACEMARYLRAGEFRCVHMSHNIAWNLPNTGRDGEVFCFDTE
ncbi:MAG TPA: MBL fold metallo-hydrolase [Methanoregulaceae archaeon]|nr:MBL fold metallo-hydrolase [Methanoregulaceae archaeon]